MLSGPILRREMAVAPVLLENSNLDVDSDSQVTQPILTNPGPLEVDFDLAKATIQTSLRRRLQQTISRYALKTLEETLYYRTLY